jgi:phosphoribosyl 1,2-cyclic phosphodiesterase
LVSHLHWDHVQGLPFCRAVDREDAVIRVYVPAQDGATALQLLSQAMSPPSFPITPEGLGGTWTFTAIEPGTVDVSAYSVVATEVAHKGGRTYGYRVERDGVSIGYVPDHVPAAGVSDTTRGALAGDDVLIHDAQFPAPDLAIAELYGDATVDYCYRLAEQAEVRRLVLFHHSPVRVDDDVDRLCDLAPPGLDVTIAREGETITL